MHDINFIDHAITFACGSICGAIIMLIGNMLATMIRDRREVKRIIHNHQQALVELDMLAKIRECLRHHTAIVPSNTTKDLIHWIDEQFLNQ